MRPPYSLFIVIVLLASSHVVAQVQEQLTPTERKQKTIVTEPQTLYKGFFRAGTAFSYGTIDKIFNADRKRESLATNIWANSWFLQTFFLYGVSDRLQVEVSIPYKVEQIYQSFKVEAPDLGIVRVEKWKSKSTGLSDISIASAYQIITENEARPSITAFVTGIIPTGEKNPTNVNPDNPRDYDKATGAGEASINALLRLRKVQYPYSYTFYGSYQHFFGGKKKLNSDDSVEKPFKSGANLSVGGNFNFHLNDWIAVRNNLDYFFSVRDEYAGVKEKDNSWSIQYYPGLSFQIKRFRIDQAVVVPLAGKLSSADPSYIIIFQYTF